MKTKLVSLLLTVAMLASATLIPISAAAEEVTPDATPVSDVDTSATEATPMPEETPLAEAEPEASPAPVVDAPAATVAPASYFTYTVSGGKATITDVNNSISGNIIIPDTLGGYPVTSIDSGAFYDCSSLTSVIIPDSVTSIGSSAFSRCSSLTSVTIPDSVTSIGKSAFYHCDSLESITIPFVGATKNGTSNTHFGYIFGTSFYSDNDDYVPVSLKTVVITGGTSIGSNAFQYCYSLTSVTIGNSVTSIGNSAFSNCSSLTSVTIPDSVTSIGQRAFYSCDSLTSVTIPDSVTSIGSYAFDDCYKLIEVYNRSSLSITAGSSSYGSVGYYAKNVYTPSSGKSKLFTFGDYLFYNDNGSYLLMEYQGNDTAISLPDTVNRKGYAIYDCAFYYLRDDLTAVTIPDSVTSIGNYAFWICDSLTSVTIGNSVTSIGSYAFYLCSSLTSVTIPDSVTSIGSSAFYHCSSLTSVTIPDSVTSIGDCAFESCSSLTSVTIGNKVTSIGDEAFRSCSSLALVTIESATIARNPSYGYLVDYAQTVLIPATITTVGSYVTSNFTNVESITMDGVLYTVYSDHSHADASVWDENTCTLCGLYNPCHNDHDMQGATCDTPSTCNRCGHTEGDPLGHDMQGATCTAPDICTRCGAVGEPLGHITFDAPTCTMPSICERCDEIAEDALGHDLLDATCTSPVCCSRCAYKTGVALGHDMQDATCTQPSTCSRCTHSVGEPLGHDFGDAICTVPATCSRCGHTDGEPLGHDEVFHEAKAPTCLAFGWEAYVTCTRCEYITYEEIPALGHNMQDATCTLPSSCSRCDHTEGEPLGHDEVHHAAKAPTCTQVGWHEYVSCTRCDYSTYLEIPALGHDLIPADCLTPATCSVCGHTEGEALGHAWSEWEETLAPTQTTDGSESRVCTRDASHTEIRVKVHPALVAEYACGANVTARLYPAAEEGKYALHIFGTGAMANYTATTMPWYEYLTAITRVTVYDGVTGIGASAFRGATALEVVTLPASVTVIGESAFRGCTALATLSKLESVTTLGKYAFFGCSALTSLTLGENATLASVGTYAFSGCDSLALLEVQSQAVLDGLTGYDVYGYLLSAVQTLVTPAALTAPDYVGATYQTVDPLTRGGADYTAYSHHSHAQDSTVWTDDTCTECGVTRGPALATGDINADGIVDIADIATVIDAASGTVLDPANYPGDPDVNADGVVDIADIAKVIDVAAGAVV